jgi:hypothetical protein
LTQVGLRPICGAFPDRRNEKVEREVGVGSSSGRIAVVFATAVAMLLAVPALASALSFQATSQSPLPGMTGVNDIASGDFNGDGDSDLAVACEAGVVIWLSDGDGTFTKGETLPIATGTNATGAAVVVGDFNGDNKDDLAYSDGPYKIYVALGEGDGTFSAPDAATEITAPFDVEAGQLVAADFNGDSKDDLAMAGGIHVNGNESAEYQVFLSDGDGTFTLKSAVPVPIPLESGVIALASGDYDDDGHMDLAILTQPFMFSAYEDNQVLGEEGQGDGTFTAAPENPISVGLTEAGFAYAETTADLDGSNGDDLLVTTSHEYSTVPLLGSSGEFLSADPSGAMTGPAIPFRVTAADIDGDGVEDAIPAYFNGEGSFGIGLSDGSGALTAAEGSPYKTEQEHFFDSSVVAGDFNGDGSPDIAIGSNANTNGNPLTQGVAVMISSRELGISPSQIDFGDTKVGETARDIVKLTGLGAPATEVSQVVLQTSPDNPFSIADPSACETVSYGEECELEVEYTPISRDPSGNTLFITSNSGIGGGDTVAAIPLSGQGVAPEAALSPASQDFGSAEIGAAPVTRSFTIEATGDGSLSVSAVSLSSESDFKLADPSACVGSIAAGSSCDIAVSFDPAGSAGPRSATLTVETDAGRRTAQLNGTATTPPPPPGHVEPPATTASLKLKGPASVKAGKPVKLKVVVTNTGGSAISHLTLRTKAPKKFAKAPKAIKVASLAAGHSVTRTIKVKLKKAAKRGKKIKLKVTATAGGKTLATGSRKVKVK